MSVIQTQSDMVTGHTDNETNRQTLKNNVQLNEHANARVHSMTHTFIQIQANVALH